jgi:hypothetical protein
MREVDMAVVFVRSNLAYFSANGVFHRDGQRGYHTNTTCSHFDGDRKAFYGSEYENEIFGPICSNEFTVSVWVLRCENMCLKINIISMDGCSSFISS